MPRAGFYNDNEYRAYPFLYQKTTPSPALPDTAVVDCGIIMGLDSEYDETTHTVYLYQISRAGDTLTFTFLTTAPGAQLKPLTFTRDATAYEWQTEYAESAPADKQCAQEPAWEGFLVTGVLTDLLEQIADGQTLTYAADSYVLEPARIQSLVKSYLRSLNVGNYSRVQSLTPAVCGGPSTNPPRYIIMNRECMRGDIRFKEGHNCEITQVDRNNEIIVGAAIGAGDGGDNICEEIALFDGEAPPAGSKLLSGGPACDEIIFTVNGVNAGGSLQLLGGTGIIIKQDPNNENGLVIERVDNLLVSGCGA